VSSRALRVLHCPTVVGGHASQLARAERELGLDSRSVAFDPSPFGYEPDEILFEGGGRMRRELRRWRFLIRALRHADVVHFNFGSTIAPQYRPSAHRGRRRLYGLYAQLVEWRDAAWLARAGKAVFVTYQGDDVRGAGQLAGRLEADDVRELDTYYDASDDARKHVVVRRLVRAAAGVFALNPDLLALLPEDAEFLPYASVDVARLEQAAAPRETGTLRVAHAPTDRRIKGTRHVIRAVELLRARGHDIELVLVEGRSRRDTLDALRTADVFVDQLLVGWYGGAAVEAMALGRPVVAHIDAGDRRRTPAEFQRELPIVEATPATLEGILAGLARERRGDLAPIGRQSRAFVERWHDPLRVAQRTKAAYEDAVARISRR